MVLAGRLHPLLVHFPIGLVLVAAMAELVATMTNFQQWRAVAVANLRALDTDSSSPLTRQETDEDVIVGR